MKFDVERLLTKHKGEDGTIDYDKVNEEVNNQVNDIVAKNKPNEDELKIQFKDELEKSIFSNLGIENVTSNEQLKAYAGTLSKSADDKDKLIADFKSKYETLESNTKDLSSKLEKANGLLNSFETKSAIRKANFREDYVEDVMLIAKGRVSEEKDLATVLKEMSEDSKYSHFVNQEQPKYRSKSRIETTKQSNETKVNPYRKFY